MFISIELPATARAEQSTRFYIIFVLTIPPFLSSLDFIEFLFNYFPFTVIPNISFIVA